MREIINKLTSNEVLTKVSGEGRLQVSIREDIKKSWARCEKYGIKATDSGSNLVLDSKSIDRIQFGKRDLLEVAIPIMKHLMEFVSGSGFLGFIADQEGFVLEIIGEENLLEEAKEANLCVGSNWSEEHGGTNGIGTSMALQRPFQVNGSEHYIVGLQSWTCSAAPIRTETGKIIGYMQLSGPSKATHKHTLGMVVAAVRAVEEQMRVGKRNRELVLVNSHLENIFHHMTDGVVIFDNTFICTNVNSVATKLLRKEEEELLGKKCEAIFNTKYTGDILKLIQVRKNFTDIEVLNEKGPSVNVYLISGDPIYDQNYLFSGFILFIKSSNRVNKLVNRLSGAQASFSFDDIVGDSYEIQNAIRVAKAASESDSTIVLQGETGTGKEIFAQAIHNNSLRKNGPFVALNCGAIPRELIDSELFGYVEGSFTGARKGGRPGKFELAEGGTLFLDEVNDLNFSKQVSLLRAIQERKITRVGGNKEIQIDVRIIVATNKNLYSEVEKGNFRQDLYYRLSVITINIPPLRERLGDIPLLFSYFMKLESNRLNKEKVNIDPDLLEKLQQYDWPGNVRELQNTVERIICIQDNEILGSKPIPKNIIENKQELQSSNKLKGKDSTMPDISLERLRNKRVKDEIQKEQIIEYLRIHGGNITTVAKQMGLSRSTVYRKLKQYNIKI